ncbi:Putative HAD-hydrolase YfnB [Sedimentisphaera cyanobacteriorum]|uniref:HAD-hydrolase YfnB n=1 Tax=Sedimentisphaera cyanobacteriorum TaxID=1940790 RepID=A0A1Q2HNF8_9BACT|nr:HAD family hydrolase [Sedimentisphaera cyanobacteriorum]AQQ08972.1 Putative HAD-hydrolase YfnB [Sedimentisphaera cyanobacteriorum]
MTDKHRIKCVVFDLDDTLYPEREYCLSGFKALGQQFAPLIGVSQAALTETLIESFNQASDSRVFNRALENLGTDYSKELIGQMVEKYRAHSPEISLPQAAANLLSKLKNKYTLDLITDGFLPAQELKIESLGIKGFFDYIICTEKLGRKFWKPAPKAFYMIAEKGGFTPEECVYIADNPEKDFKAPNHIGWHTIMITAPKNINCKESLPEEYLPGKVIDSLEDIGGLLL